MNLTERECMGIECDDDLLAKYIDCYVKHACKISGFLMLQPKLFMLIILKQCDPLKERKIALENRQSIKTIESDSYS